MPVDLTLTIDEARAKRHEMGIKKYRQDPTGPYIGDPIEHAYEEALDLMNYLEEMDRQGECGQLEGFAGFYMEISGGIYNLSLDARRMAGHLQAWLMRRNHP